jgi:ABC-type multidrug transport system ATPase subunit
VQAAAETDPTTTPAASTSPAPTSPSAPTAEPITSESTRATTPARTSGGRPAAAKAAAAKAAAAKSESAAKAGAARAAATKAAAAKAAAARTAATAAARAATAAAAARATAGEERPEVDTVVAAPVNSDAAPLATDEGSGSSAAAEQTALEQTAPEQTMPEQTMPEQTATVPAASVPTAPETATTHEPTNPQLSVTSEGTASGATESEPAAQASATVAEPARVERRPFWRLNRSAPKAAPTDSLPTGSTPVDQPVEQSVQPAVQPAPARPAPADVAASVAGSSAAPATAEPSVPRSAPLVRKPVAPRTGASTVVSATAPIEIEVSGLNKRFGQNVAVAGVNLEVRAGSFYGIVGPNGAGKTTTLSMITGLLRPDSGTINVHGIDVWADPIAAKRAIGVLPDRLRLFDRLTGAQLLYYSGVLRGLEAETVRARSADLAAAFGLESALNRLVADYSAGMTKKIALACAMIHSPRVLVLDEPFESVDPVSAVNVTEILQRYVASGGTVILSSHGMDLIQRVCDNVAIIVQGSVLASGTIDEVRGNASLEERFVDLAGGRKVAEGLEWLHNFSD